MNFTPESKTLTTISVLSAPTYALNTFGDSLTGGLPSNWPGLLTNALGWSFSLRSCGGCTTNDEAPVIYDTVVTGDSASTWLLGQNDAPSTTAAFDQFSHATRAQNAWLAIPEGSAKLRAQSQPVTQGGTWTPSDIYSTTGLRTVQAGSTLTATVSGSTIYVGLTSLTSSDYTVDVLIDGVDQGTVAPVSAHVGENQAAESYGLRYVVGGARTATHTVQIICIEPDSSGCYVDWIGSNGLASVPNLPPYVWTGVSYRTEQPDPQDNVDARSGIVRTIESQLESDGLAIRLADIESVFSGPALPQCVSDGVHPSDCGNQIEETVWLSAMSFLATEAQRIDLDASTSAVVRTPLTLDEAVATSGLPVNYSVLSGPGVINNGMLTAQQAGTIAIEADQSGNATVLPAEPVQFSVTAQLPTAVTLSSSESTVYEGVTFTLTASVTANGTPVTTGNVTFYDGAVCLKLARSTAAV
ncbi:MAG: hypothetical protein ABSE53_07555 [Terracidiphilus sp.]|jgi:hypothetical protein